MPFAPARRLRWRRGDRTALEAMVRKRSIPQRLAFCAQVLLCCADGLPNRQIKRRLHTSVDTVLHRRNRYDQESLDGLDDRPRPSRPPTFSLSGATLNHRPSHPGSCRGRLCTCHHFSLIMLEARRWRGSTLFSWGVVQFYSSGMCRRRPGSRPSSVV